MLNRRLFISAAICVAATYGAYYEQARYDPSAEGAKARAVYGQMARSDAEDAYRQCKKASPDESCNDTYGDTLRSSRSWYGKHGGAYRVVDDTQTRDLYIIVALVSGLVAFSQLRRRKQGRDGSASSSQARSPVMAHPLPSPSSYYEATPPQQSATAEVAVSSSTVEAEPRGHLVSASSSGQTRSVPQPRRLKSLTAFPNLLFGGIFSVTLIAEFSHNYNPWDALGYALGVCLIPLVLGLAWNATKGEARTLKWMYVGTSSLFALIFLAAQVQDAKDATSQATLSAVTPYVAPPALETPMTAGSSVQSAPRATTATSRAEATDLSASYSMAAPSSSYTDVPQPNARRSRRPPATTTEEVRPENESIERPQSPPVAPEKVAHSYRDFSSMVALGTPDEVREAIERGAGVNERSGGTFPVVVAARRGRADIVELLLAHGAPVDTADSDGRTAMFYAKMNADATTIAVLKKWGAANPFTN